MALLLPLLFIALLPANLSSLALESTDPLTGQVTRWEGWVGNVEASGLPEGAQVELVDSLGTPLPGSAATAAAGRANLSVVSRLPGLYRLTINGTVANATVRLDGSFLTAPVLYFEGPGGALAAEVCVYAVRNSADKPIPIDSLDGIGVSLGDGRTRTGSAGCALLFTSQVGFASTSVGGLPGPVLRPPAAPDGLLFSEVEAGGQAARFLERGFLRAVRLSAAANLRNFTLVVEPVANGSLFFWSRANASGVARIFLVVEGAGTPQFCPRRGSEPCRFAPLPAVSIEGGRMIPLPGFGVIRMDTTIENIYHPTVAALAAGIGISAIVLFAARRRRPPAATSLSAMPPSDKP